MAHTTSLPNLSHNHRHLLHIPGTTRLTHQHFQVYKVGRPGRIFGAIAYGFLLRLYPWHLNERFVFLVGSNVLLAFVYGLRTLILQTWSLRWSLRLVSASCQSIL